MVEPVDPFQGGQFEVVESFPGSVGPDEFGFVEADDRLGHRVVIGVASGSDRGHDTVFSESFDDGMIYRTVLSTSILANPIARIFPKLLSNSN